jgi:hypothetical protein
MWFSFEENHKSGTGESCEIGNPATLGMTKRRGLLKGKKPLPRVKAVVGAAGMPFHRPFTFPGRHRQKKGKKKCSIAYGTKPSMTT